MSPSVILWKPKTAENIGHALRACSCFGSRLIIVDPRCDLRKNKHRRRVEATATHAKHVSFSVITESQARPLLRAGFTVPVELSDKATCLSNFAHPPDAVYIFGPEDGDVPHDILASHPSVRIPSRRCLNLSAAVCVVLYDRAAKLTRGQDE